MDILQLLLNFFTSNGYQAAFFVLVICGMGVPIPEDITLVAGGIICGLGYANVHVMFAVCMVGVLLGDTFMFVLGRVFGSKVLRIRPVAKILTRERFEMVQHKFVKYGNWVMFVARFLPGLRSPTYLAAGLTRGIPFWRFLLLDGFAALISVPVWVYLGYFGAYKRDWLLMWVHRGQSGVLLVLVCLLVFFGVTVYLRRRRARSEACQKSQ